ncbi:MAG TPA: hypothetical protein PKK50_01875 [Myxococcota bacterium]|nr:hypothetical protein [Myxococcota bacterium]HNZ02868.1 hypothetical protein [Myxococcota bacterium]HOD07894.1 hypothetical protein [Myxococcota bacterium]
MKVKRAKALTALLMTVIFLGGSSHVCLHSPDEHHHFQATDGDDQFHAHATRTAHDRDCEHGQISVHQADHAGTHRHAVEHTACSCACHSSPDVSPRVVLTPPSVRPDQIATAKVFTMSATLPVPYRPPILSF